MKLFSSSKNAIKSESGERVDPLEMLRLITERSWKAQSEPFGYDSWEQFHEINHSLDGPNGLCRHKIDGRCIGHGAGTWDLVIGEFC